jgi:primosomal protein N' (replication factor Y)
MPGPLFAHLESVGAPSDRAGSGLYARVALDTPVRREFSYRVPAPFIGALQPGCRVRVPFGARERLAVVVGVDPSPPEGVAVERIKEVAALLDSEPLLTPALLRLARRIADTCWCSWGQALAAMLPAALRSGRIRRAIPVVETAAAPSAEELREMDAKQPKQARAFAWLLRAGGPVEVREFLRRTGLSRAPLESLARRGLVRFGRITEVLDPFAGAAAVPIAPHALNTEQAAAAARIRSALESGGHRDFLLFGITGSGKTEVYLNALDRCLELERGAIVLVPEIALTPQTVARFRGRCGEVAVLHSGLTDAERHDQWQALRAGRMRVVVGARSALFAPVPRLGLIIVDEEHETSFKQESTPRYHARDVARERAHLEKAVCVLGSATPALESWAAARTGEIELLELPHRVAGGRLPEVRIVDMRHEKPEKGHWLVISRPLEEALARALQRGERAILFLNQRGFAPAWHCPACGGSAKCPRCSVALTFHRWRKKALCHACLAEQPPPTRCAACGGPVAMVGVGTERAEDTLRRMFPDARIARMDRDTMLRREAYEEVYRSFTAGEFDILLGTQMVAKGLDFPEVTVVGVLNADTALHHPDFRASERCFNLIAQVSGRAGRGPKGGCVVVQTWLPGHPALLCAVRHDYRGFAAQELEERRAFAYPPAARVVRVVCEAARADHADRAAEEAAGLLRAAARGAPGVEVLGPAPHPVERLRNRWRRQILVKSPASGPLAVRPVLEGLCQRSGVTVDSL